MSKNSRIKNTLGGDHASTMRPGFPGHVLFLGPSPGVFPEIWLLSEFFPRPSPIDRSIPSYLLSVYSQCFCVQSV